jgi:O-antigen/teichoic acid export membrane protein
MKLFRPGKSWSQRVAHAGLWAFALHLAEQFVILCRLFLLAVLLAPRDFGLFGMALISVMALDTLSQTGFEQALIHKKEEIRPYLEVAWTVLFLRGLLLAVLLFAMAPWAAAFFREPDAVPLIRSLGLALLFRGLTNIGVVSFQKNLEFHKQFAFRFSGALADLLVAIIAASILRSAWALVFGYVAADLTRLVVSYLIHPFRPRLRLDWGKSRELFDYGMWMLFVGITLFVSTNGAGVVIGKILGAAALGFFQMAQRIPNVVVKGLGDTLGDVAFPAYAELQGSADRVRGAYNRIAGFSAALLTPAAVGIIAVGHDFTRIFLGPKWMPMVPALLLLAAAWIVTSMVWTGRPAFMGRGQPQVVFHMQVARAVTVFLCIYPLSSRWGITGAALAILLSQASALPTYFVNIRRHFGITWKDMALMFIPPLAASLLMALALWGLRVMTLPLLPGQHLIDIVWIVCMILAGGAIYATLLGALQMFVPGFQPLRGIVEALRD